eukprot:1834321-Pleurochrysis_carterae.AAC.2
MPGVQKPHCDASASTSASCTVCGAPSLPTPSTVTISQPSHAASRRMHAFTGISSPASSSDVLRDRDAASPCFFIAFVRPNWASRHVASSSGVRRTAVAVVGTGARRRRTVHAPQPPSRQDNFVPVSSSFSRKYVASIVVLATSALTRRGAPFTLNSTSFSGGTVNNDCRMGTGERALCASSLVTREKRFGKGRALLKRRALGVAAFAFLRGSMQRQRRLAPKVSRYMCFAFTARAEHNSSAWAERHAGGSNTGH